MGHSQTEKARSHARIVAIAARRLREEGLAGVGVAGLMKEAGLTVGGFYKHFASRDDLVAQAVGACFAEARDAVDAQAAEGPRTLAHVADWYLTSAHRDNPGGGCPFAALAPDLARSDPRVRALATAEIRAKLAGLARAADKDGVPLGRARAILAYSALIGALSLAHTVNDEALSREILAGAAAQLKAGAAAGKSPSRPRSRPPRSVQRAHDAIVRGRGS